MTPGPPATPPRALGKDVTPTAFSKDLVGTYSAFENIDLEEYLHVRGFHQSPAKAP